MRREVWERCVFLCHMISCWWRNFRWLWHCSLYLLICVCLCICIYRFIYVCVCVNMQDWGESYMAHVDNLVILLHRLHLWQKRRGMENRREHNREGGRSMREVEKALERMRAESVIWLLRNSTGDSCCYTRSDSLPLQLCRPYAQYDFTTSSLSLEIPFFHAALSPPSPLSVCWRFYPEREAGARFSHSPLPQMVLRFIQALVS